MKHERVITKWTPSKFDKRSKEIKKADKMTILRQSYQLIHSRDIDDKEWWNMTGPETSQSSPNQKG